MDPTQVAVLVVEDDEFTRIATIDILKSCRYEVEAVENGRDALELLVRKPGAFDLILCDVMLPVMNGIELLDALQKDYDHSMAHIPVVMTSSNEEMGVVTACLSKGAKDYLIKPIQVNTAKTLVRHVWLSRKQEKNAIHTAGSKALWQDLEVIRTIGKGTHGTVVLAKRKRDEAIVAVKKVRMSQISDNGRKQAENEVILLKSLYHVNIVRFYDSFMLDDELNIVMEYSDGGNLRQLVKLRSREKMGTFPENVIMSWFAQLVLAVAYIHGKNVLHRDLKAQNVFLTRKNVVKLGDFGISKALSGDDMANTACGTPESMSPEICRGEPYGKKSDIWSLGCVLYEMMMLKRPFEAASLPEMFTRICQGDYAPIPSTFSRELRLLIQLMLQQDPSKRPTIEDICRFPFVQAPIQAFLSQHVDEFQKALELEARLHQLPSHANTENNGGYDNEDVEMSVAEDAVKDPNSMFSAQMSSQDVVMRSNDQAFGTKQVDNLRDNAAIAAVAVGLTIDQAPSINGTFNMLGNLSASDEISQLGDVLRTQVNVTDHRSGFFTIYQNVVSSKEVLQVIQSKHSKNDAQALKTLQELINCHVVNVVASHDTLNPDLTKSSTLLRFQMDENSALNMKYISRDTTQPGVMDACIYLRKLAAELHSSQDFPDGISSGFNSPSEFSREICIKYRQFLKSVALLQRVDIGTLPRQERQAFFINIYNTMVLHGFIEFGVPSTSPEYRSFEKDVVYSIGGLNFSLGDIKHGILRCNRKPPSNYWEKQMEPNNPRMKFRLHNRDPRSLLVLLEACSPVTPPSELPILTPKRLDTDLEEQVEKYCARHVHIDTSREEITVPRVFRLYRDDFGSSEAEMIGWLSQYIENCPNNLINYKVRYAFGIAV